MSEPTTLLPTEGPPLKKAKSISGSSTPVPIPQTIVQDGKSTNTDMKQDIQEDMLKKSNRPVEEIIDGSEVRKFLNKTLTSYMVKGLHELVQRWENGDLKITDDAKESKSLVINEFCEILKNLSNKD